MRSKIVILAIWLTAVAANGQQTTNHHAHTEVERWNALGAKETGHDNFAKGRCGEITQWQILKREWRATTSLSVTNATNPEIALAVCKLDMKQRVWRFVDGHGRQPTDLEWALIWHCPAHVGHPRKDEQQYAVEFLNLLNK